MMSQLETSLLSLLVNFSLPIQWIFKILLTKVWVLKMLKQFPLMLDHSNIVHTTTTPQLVSNHLLNVLSILLDTQT